MSKFIIAASLVGSALLSTVAITPALAQTIPHWQYDCYVIGKQPNGRPIYRGQCGAVTGATPARGGESPGNPSGASGAMLPPSIRCDPHGICAWATGAVARIRCRKGRCVRKVRRTGWSTGAWRCGPCGWRQRSWTRRDHRLLRHQRQGRREWCCLALPATDGGNWTGGAPVGTGATKAATRAARAIRAIRGGPQGNNGFGNGDQTAPGGSGTHNNAENASPGRDAPGGSGHGGKGDSGKGSDSKGSEGGKGEGGRKRQVTAKRDGARITRPFAMPALPCGAEPIPVLPTPSRDEAVRPFHACCRVGSAHTN